VGPEGGFLGALAARSWSGRQGPLSKCPSTGRADLLNQDPRPRPQNEIDAGSRNRGASTQSRGFPAFQWSVLLLRGCANVPFPCGRGHVQNCNNKAGEGVSSPEAYREVNPSPFITLSHHRHAPPASVTRGYPSRHFKWPSRIYRLCMGAGTFRTDGAGSTFEPR